MHKKLNKQARQILLDEMIMHPQVALEKAALINGFIPIDIDDNQQRILYEGNEKIVNCRIGGLIQGICDTGLGFDDDTSWSVFHWYYVKCAERVEND